MSDLGIRTKDLSSSGQLPAPRGVSVPSLCLPRGLSPSPVEELRVACHHTGTMTGTFPLTSKWLSRFTVCLLTVKSCQDQTEREWKWDPVPEK